MRGDLVLSCQFDIHFYLFLAARSTVYMLFLKQHLSLIRRLGGLDG